MKKLFIFSNDLRLQDNIALYNASLGKNGLIAAYIFNPKKWENHNDSPLKIKFQLNHLHQLKDELIRKNISFKVIHADRIKTEVDKILNFVSEYKINEVFINREYGCNERLRDENLKSELGEINVNLNIFDSSIINPELIKTGTGNYFRVFTPYSKVFRAELTEKDLAILPEPLDQNLLVEDSDDIPNYELTDENFLNAISKYPVGSETVINIFEQFVKDKVSDYKKILKHYRKVKRNFGKI